MKTPQGHRWPFDSRGNHGKNPARAALFLLLAALGCGMVFADDATGGLEKRIAENRAVAKELFVALKGELENALHAGGPASAIPACKENVPEIGKTFKKKYPGWFIGRTTLRTRNPANAPDEWERKVLERFEARRAAGEDPKRIEHSEFVEKDGVSIFRYMKAIPTLDVCTLCHGPDIMPDVAAKLDELYPEDTARGFNVGDIRGAFTFAQPE